MQLFVQAFEKIGTVDKFDVAISHLLEKFSKNEKWRDCLETPCAIQILRQKVLKGSGSTTQNTESFQVFR